MGDEPIRAFQKVSCVCGAQVRVDPQSQDRHVTCPSCGNTFDFVVTLDSARKRSKVSIVLSRAAMKTEGESLGKTPPPKAAPKTVPKAEPKAVTRVTRKVSGKTVHALMGACECGASFPLEDTGELTTIQSCPQCNRIYRVVFKLESGTRQKSAMLVLEKTAPARGGRTTVAPKSTSSPTPTGKPVKSDGDIGTTDFFTPGKKGRTRVTKPRTKAPADIPPGAQGVPCGCGETFIVRKRDLTREATCEGCGRVVSFEEARDPQSLAPIIRIRTNRKF